MKAHLDSGYFDDSSAEANAPDFLSKIIFPCDCSDVIEVSQRKQSKAALNLNRTDEAQGHDCALVNTKRAHTELRFAISHSRRRRQPPTYTRPTTSHRRKDEVHTLQGVIDHPGEWYVYTSEAFERAYMKFSREVHIDIDIIPRLFDGLHLIYMEHR